MQLIIVALVLLSAVTIAVCHDKRTAYRAHSNLLKQFPCRGPQPKVFELKDVIDEKILKDLTDRGLYDKIVPAVTVLHRCNCTGWCEKPTERCLPASEPKDVTLTFSVWAKSIRYFDVKAKNETKCECREQQNSFIK